MIAVRYIYKINCNKRKVLLVIEFVDKTCFVFSVAIESS